MIEVTREARGIATLWLAREDKHNALAPEMLEMLEHSARALAEDSSVRVVVLAARGRSFCAGGDLAWMEAQRVMDRATRLRESGRIARALAALYDLPQPLIGRVQGNAFGGGVGLISVCDVAVGHDAVRMGLTETRLGLIPANIGPYVLARMGAARAARVFMNARIFDAGEAQELDLLARVVPEADLDAAVEAEVTPYLACAPGAVAEAKRLMRQLTGEVTQAQVDHAIGALADRWDSDEARAGLRAFFDKAAPPWG